jgi:hypothetical protein
MVLLAAHRLCRVVVACVMLAGLALRTPGKACCGAGVAEGDLLSATSSPAQNSRTGCHHCSKHKPTVQAPPGGQANASCSTAAARECGGGGAGKKDSCRGGGCAAVCCHVNAVTAAPPAVAALDAMIRPISLAVQVAPARADRDGIFHPPRA